MTEEEDWSFSFFSIPRSSQEVKQFLEQTPTFDINQVGSYGWNPLNISSYMGCLESVSALLALPQVDVNSQSGDGCTPFGNSCYAGHIGIVEILLKDPRVDINISDNDNRTPLWWACKGGYFEIVKLIIASGREIKDLDAVGFSGFCHYTATAVATCNSHTGIASLLESFGKDKERVRHMVRVELGIPEAQSAELFSLVIFLCDGLVRIGTVVGSDNQAARFFSIAERLPIELQMILCNRVAGLTKDSIPSKDSEPAFKHSARVLSQIK